LDIRDIRDTRDIHASGALASVNLLKNNIGDEQMQALIKIKKEKGMISLCGLRKGQTEADFSNQDLRTEDAKGALVTLDISGNLIGAEGAKHLAPALQEW